MSSRNTFEAISYTNEFDQVIQPGDPVIYAGTACKSTCHTKAVFEGVYVNKAGSVQALRVGMIPHSRFRWDAVAKKYNQSEVMRKAILPLCRVYKLA